jgi:hypothetical protein
MSDTDDVALTAGMAIGAMILLFGSLAAFVGAALAQQDGGSATLPLALAVVLGLGGLAMLVQAGRRVLGGLKEYR